ncbi:hypothetical protein ED733_001169 [Metarhizium rileyi]|uniref:Uncharacterized protein n=1 Tax=Metarhizium rileyi (strain RCEF 4871) TaxID=1649241 RepID=A0A5C6FYP5_METRR|nr:hypothetical protein ED733_001169 [Metarhizium rileyi]
MGVYSIPVIKDEEKGGLNLDSGWTERVDKRPGGRQIATYSSPGKGSSTVVAAVVSKNVRRDEREKAPREDSFHVEGILLYWENTKQGIVQGIPGTELD